MVTHLYDAHGNLIANARERESKAITGKHPSVPTYDHWSRHPSNGLNPARLASLLRNAEDGDVRAQVELYEDILDKDPTIYAALETRAAAVLNKSWDVIAVEGSGEAGQAQADWVRSTLENLSRSKDRLAGAYTAEWLGFTDLMAHLLMAPYYGFASAELHWDARTWRVDGARIVSQKHFIWGKPSERGMPSYDPYELRIRTADAETDGIVLPLYKYVTHVHRAKGSLPPRAGIGRTLVWWYLFKNYAVRSMIQAAERHGMPLRIGKYDTTGEGGSTDSRAIIERAVRELGSDAAAVIDKASEIIFPEVKPSPGDIHEKIIALVNAEISKAVLGHTATTESTAGKLGKEDQAMAVQYYRIERDARALEETINLQIVEPMAAWNDGKALCYFKIRYEPEENMAETAQMLATVATLAPISHASIYERFDLTPPVAGETTTTLHLQDPLMAMLPNGTRVANAAPSPNQKKKPVTPDGNAHSTPGAQLTMPLLPASASLNPYTGLYSTLTRSPRISRRKSRAGKANS